MINFLRFFQKWDSNFWHPEEATTLQVKSYTRVQSVLTWILDYLVALLFAAQQGAFVLF